MKYRRSAACFKNLMLYASIMYLLDNVSRVQIQDLSNRMMHTVTPTTRKLDSEDEDQEENTSDSWNHCDNM